MIAAALAEQTPRLVMTREFAAPRSVVWEAWTEPTQLAKWFGPRSFTIPRIELDVRPGGAIRCDMRAPDGTISTNLGAYTHVVEPERLGATLRYEQNRVVVYELLQTITLAERAGKTLLTLEVHVLRQSSEAETYLASLEGGWRETLDKLGALVTR